MSKKVKQSRSNRKSFLLTMLFALPAFVMGTSLVNKLAGTTFDSSGLSAFPKLTSFILAIFIVVWTIRRLHDASKSGWWSLLLLPPATLFFLIYAAATPSKSEENEWGQSTEKLSIFGIRARGGWRITGITLLALFLTYLGLLYSSFLFI